MYVNKMSNIAHIIPTPATVLIDMNSDNDTFRKTVFSMVLSCGTLPPVIFKNTHLNLFQQIDI